MNLYHVEECKVTENWGWLKCGRRVAGMGNPELLSWAMLMVEAEVERTESRLLKQIADLQAENAKLKADCASYDTVLNQVAIGYLEATEKLQQVEAQEPPVVTEPTDILGDSSIVWNMAYAEKTEAIITPVAEKEIETLRGTIQPLSIRKVVTKKNEVMVFFEILTQDGIKDVAIFPKSWHENKDFIESMSVRSGIKTIEILVTKNVSPLLKEEYIFSEVVL